MQKSVTYLGHIISEHEVEIDPETTRIIRHWPSPRSLREMKRFLGLASYYREFISGFARIAAPLHQLTRKEHSLLYIKLSFLRGHLEKYKISKKKM